MVSLTRRAAEKLRMQKNEGKYIRLQANGEGRKDVNYNLQFTDVVCDDDILYMSYGIKILVGGSTRKFFENIRVDYIGENGTGKFVFNQNQNYSGEY